MALVGPELERRTAAIYNDCRMVREYARGAGRQSHLGLLRQQAILKLGLTLREAFSNSDDFETLLHALVDGLSPKDVNF